MTLWSTASRGDYVYQRNFDVLPHAPNLHVTSFPESIGLEDVANSTVPWANKCDLRGAGGDGAINADDAICTFWGDGTPRVRSGTFTISMIDETSCALVQRRAQMTTVLGATFLGVPFAIEGARAYLVQAGGPLRGNAAFVANRGTLRGRCVPGFPTYTIHQGCSRHLLPIPDDTVHDRLLEVLCGTEGTDWTMDANGRLASCPNGAFDPVSGVEVTAWTPITDPDYWPNTDDGVRFLIMEVILGHLLYGGLESPFLPGGGVYFTVRSGYQARDYSPPVDDSLCN